MMYCKVIHFFTHILLFIFLLQSSANPLLPEKCSLRDSICITERAQAMLQTFVQGVPEIGIKKLDKLHTSDIFVDNDVIHYVMTNVLVSGLSNATIDSIEILMPLKLIRIAFHTKKLVIDSGYQVEGILFSLPIVGNSNSSRIILKNWHTEILISFDIEKDKQDKDVMNLKSYFYGSDAVDGVHYYFDNFYNGDKTKGDTLNALLNKNWRTTVSNFGRSFTNIVIGDIFEAIKTYLHSRPLEELALFD